MAAVCEDLDEDYRCGYCLQTFRNMIDPRMLPCGHVFCFGCMDNDYSEWEGFACVRCQKFHKGVTPRGLPRARLKKPKPPKPAPSKSGEMVCERGTCGKTPVLMYCYECNAKLCQSHVTSHMNFFEDEHKVITIEEYMSAPHCGHCGRRYKDGPALCEKHRQQRNSSKDKDRAPKPDPVPALLTLKGTETVDTPCYSVSHRTDGDILLACEDGVKIFNNNRKLSNYGHPCREVKAVVKHLRDVYILHKKVETYAVDMSPPDLKQTRTLFECPAAEDMQAMSMSMSDKFIVVHMCEQKDKWSRSLLVVYEFLIKKTRTISMEGGYSSTLLPDGHIAVMERDCLAKYRLGEEKLSAVWRCKGLLGPDRVCVDSSGRLFVSTKKWPMSFYVISPEGQQLCELKIEKFRPSRYLGQMSIRGNELVLPVIKDNQSTLNFLTISY